MSPLGLRNRSSSRGGQQQSQSSTITNGHAPVNNTTTTSTNIDVIATLDRRLYRRYEKAVAAGAVVLRADLVAWARAVKAEVDPEGNLKNFKPDSFWMEKFMERNEIDLEVQLVPSNKNGDIQNGKQK